MSAPQQILANIGWAAKYDNDAGTKYFTISEQDIHRADGDQNSEIKPKLLEDTRYIGPKNGLK